MIRLAAKTAFHFIARAFAADALAVAHTTPAAMAHTLGPLAAVAYKRAVFHAENISDADVTVTLKGAGSALGAVDLAAGAAGSVEVDVGGLEGSNALTVEVEVTTAGTGTGDVFAFVDVEQPLVDGC